MTDFQLKMQEAAAKQKHKKINLQNNLKQMQNKISLTKASAQSFLDNLSKEFSDGDPRLLLNQSSNNSNSVGFSISYQKRTNSIRPTFSVSVICQPDSVEIHVTDGLWEQIKGVLGAWGDWTDDKIIYSGTLDESKIRIAMEDAFIKWYTRAMEVPDEHHI